MQVKFREWTCALRFATYGNGRTAIQLVDAVDGSAVAVASVNIVDATMAAHEIAVKDYSENEGMLKALVDAGVVSEPVRYVPSGFVNVPICVLLRRE